MKKMKKMMIYSKSLFRIIVLIIVIAFPELLVGQEKVVDLNNNPVLTSNKFVKNVLKGKIEPISLPFYDDFSYNDVFPDSKLWCDRNVFINSDLAYRPISYGVATFDALDSIGKLHNNLIAGVCDTADFLTSRPIRLDSIFGDENRKLVAKDSVYLSFFYQPLKKIENQSLENRSDSLCLEFYSSTDSSWHHVWSTYRFAFEDIDSATNKGRYFIEQIIPITDENLYFNKDFRFRFYNYATLHSDMNDGFQNNAGRWNLDYIYLDYGRSMNNYYKDVCFVNNGHSFLKNYYSMPNNQFNASVSIYDQMIDNDNILISNLDKVSNNVAYSYIVLNEATGLQVWNYYSGISNIDPFFDPNKEMINGSKVYLPTVYPYTFTLSTKDSSSFLITHTISETGLGFKNNDTIRFNQKFYNYYAYDDGTPEYGYVMTDRTEVLFCERYKLNVADSLQAVKIYFNAIEGMSEAAIYNLCIWNDNLSNPNSKIYEQEIKVRYDSINQAGYIMFRLDSALFISPDNGFSNLVFYVGIDKPKNTVINLGFDVSRNSSSYSFINYTGVWEKSVKPGTVMIRPLLGKPIPEDVGIKDGYNFEGNINIYPNPATGNNINVNLENFKGENIIYLFDCCGRLCKQVESSSNICTLQLADYENGMYVVKIYNKTTGLTVVKKIMLIK